MRKVFRTFLYVGIGILVVNCDDVFEEDITDNTLTLIFPKENDTIIGNSVAFTWNSIEGVDDYRVQVLKSINDELIIDSLIATNNLIIPLESGNYDWRVRGENFAYQTAFSFQQSFLVEATNDLSTQKVFLNSPSDNFYTMNNTVVLNWDPLNAAVSYSLQVEKTVSGNSSIVFQDDELLNTSYTLDSSVLTEDARYKWAIKARNDNSETPFESHVIFLDTTSPNQPILLSPNDDATSTSTVNFSWNLGQDTGEIQSPLTSTLEIATDENFSSIIQSYSTSSSSQQHIFSSNGQFYWRVRVEDLAGNQGTVSETRSLSIE